MGWKWLANSVWRAFPHPLIYVSFLFAFAIMGPFGTYEVLSFPYRLAYWVLAVTICGVIFNAAILVGLALKPLRDWPRWARITAAIAVAGFPCALFISWLEFSFRGTEVTSSFVAWVWLCVVAIGTPLGFLRFLWLERTKIMDPLPVYSVPFLTRVEPGIGTDLVSISVQDHYVEVVTKGGRKLLLMSFADALSELDGYPGLRIHRSHWVAKSAVDGLEGSGRKISVRTKDGRLLPVSRSFLKIVRDHFKST